MDQAQHDWFVARSGEIEAALLRLAAGETPRGGIPAERYKLGLLNEKRTIAALLHKESQSERCI